MHAKLCHYHCYISNPGSDVYVTFSRSCQKWIRFIEIDYRMHTIHYSAESNHHPGVVTCQLCGLCIENALVIVF